MISPYCVSIQFPMRSPTVCPPPASYIFVAIFAVLLVVAVKQLFAFSALGGLPLGLAGLMLVLSRQYPGTNLSPVSPRTRVLFVTLAALLYVVAIGGDSSALQLIALGLFAGGWLAGAVPRQRLGGLLVLIGLICLPVVFLQGTLLLSFQRLASVMASWALDIARVPHIREGVVLETMSGALFVEEACSGMQSLLTGLVAAQIYFCWHGKGLLFSLSGIACCTAFLILGNCMRIFGIAWLYAGHGINLTEGWRHELTGTAVYLLVLALLPSLVRLLESLVETYTRWSEPWKFEPRSGVVDGGALRPLAASKLILNSIPVSLYGVLGIMAMAACAEEMIFRTNAPSANRTGSDSRSVLTRIDLPDRLAGWQQEARGDTVSLVEVRTLHQRVWTFHKGGFTAWVAAGLPYNELHPLRLCYLNRDWLITREGEIANRKTSPFSFLELHSKESSRGAMLVCYDNYDLSEQRYVGGPPDRNIARWRKITSRWQTLHARLAGDEFKAASSAAGPFCQIQVVQAGIDRHESEPGAWSIELLEAVREQLEAQFRTNSLNG